MLSSHRALLPLGPFCQSHPRLAAFPCSPAHLHRGRTLPPLTAPPRAIPTMVQLTTPRHPLLSFSLHRVARPGRPPHPCLTPPPLQKLPAATRSLFSPFSSRPHQSSSSLPFSTAYASALPTPATGDPSSSPVPVRAPPLMPLHGETLPSTTIVPN
jgi:hypothetical protein